MVENGSELLIGIASTDVTPPAGVTLVGYRPRTAEKVAHALRAEALVCRGGGGAWALITSDVIGYRREYVQIVRDRIGEKTGLAADAVLVSGTHTHSGPPTIAFGRDDQADADATCLDELQDRLVQVVVEAWENASPGSFETAWTEAPELGSNRRVEQEDGTWGNEWQDPDGKHPGYYDPTVMLVGVRRPDGTLSALLVNVGCHPVVLGPSSLEISADYVGYMKDVLEAQGAAETVMFALAGGANINPRLCIQVGAEHPRSVGEGLARIVADAVGGLQPVASGPVASNLTPWTIIRTRDAMKLKDRPGSGKDEAIHSEIMALRAGDLGFVALPGELFSEFNKMLREASPMPQTVVVSLANDYVGYLPTDEALAQGAYETHMAPADGIEGMIMEHAEWAFAAVSKKA